MKRSVVLVIQDSLGRVLLLQRSKTSRVFPEEYCLPGGKIDYIKREVFHEGSAFTGGSSTSRVAGWENDDEACVRECIEETGISPKLIIDTHIVANDTQYVVKVFKCLIPIEESEVTKEFPNREHESYGFYELNNLPEKIGKLTKLIVLQVLK